MVYVENSEIGNIKVGQDVKLEIAAYPSSEYGFFSGKIKHVAKDISVNESTGQTYYLVTIEPENQQFIGKNGKELRLMNGMVCRAKIITGRKKVMNYLLEKLNLKNA
jgi:multidrug efflux pump subunit AcrA (membrane-fusion protein)